MESKWICTHCRREIGEPLDPNGNCPLCGSPVEELPKPEELKVPKPKKPSPKKSSAKK